RQRRRRGDANRGRGRRPLRGRRRRADESADREDAGRAREKTGNETGGEEEALGRGFAFTIVGRIALCRRGGWTRAEARNTIQPRARRGGTMIERSLRPRRRPLQTTHGGARHNPLHDFQIVERDSELGAEFLQFLTKRTRRVVLL